MYLYYYIMRSMPCLVNFISVNSVALVNFQDIGGRQNLLCLTPRINRSGKLEPKFPELPLIHSAGLPQFGKVFFLIQLIEGGERLGWENIVNSLSPFINVHSVPCFIFYFSLASPELGSLQIAQLSSYSISRIHSRECITFGLR